MVHAHAPTAAFPVTRRPAVTRSVPWRCLAWLAVEDLLHERMLTLCHVLACAAALAPLLLLFGLRHGAIDALRQRLLQDPKIREIRPVFGQTFSRRFFEVVSSRDDVAFVIGHIRQVATGVQARRIQGSTPDAAAWTGLDVAPTAANDPLLRDNGVAEPGPGGCVLSAAAAAALGTQVGDALELRVERNLPSGLESQVMPAVVAGILPPRATSLHLVYLPLAKVEDVERFKDGEAVPELGWPGKSGVVEPEYDGALVCGRTPLPESAIPELTSGTGLTQYQPVAEGTNADRIGYPLPKGECCALLTASGSHVEQQSLDALASRLAGRQERMFPYIRPLRAALLSGEVGKTRSVLVIGLPRELRAGLGLGPPDRDEGILTGYGAADPGAGTVLLRVEGGAEIRELTVPLALRPAPLPQDVLLVGTELAGQLNALRDRPLEFEPATGTIRPLRRSYTAFRLYARTLEDVVSLDRDFRDSGVAVHTAADRIQDVLSLDRNLGLLFWLIATVASAGGLLTLAASLFASIERKRRDLGMLRLLGVPLDRLTVFPLVQSVAIGLAGFGVSLCIYLAAALIIDQVFATHLQDNQPLCSIQGIHVATAAALTLVIAAMAGVLACARIARQDPALTVRDE